MDDQQKKLETAAVYDRTAPTFDQVGPRYFRRFGQRLTELARIPEGARVLDVACGRGASLFPAAEQAGERGRVLGIDLSSGMIRETSVELSARGLSNVELRVMDAEALELPDAAFDIVLCGFAVFFFPNVHVALREFRRVLRPGGRLALSSWGGLDPRWDWYRALIQRYVPTALTRATVGSQHPGAPDLHAATGLSAAVEAAGFTDVRVLQENTDVTYSSPEEWWDTLWTHGSRRHLEQMSAEQLADFQAEAFAGLEAVRGPGGYHDNVVVLYCVASAPGE